jgi:hypothetical protein
MKISKYIGLSVLALMAICVYSLRAITHEKVQRLQQEIANPSTSPERLQEIKEILSSEKKPSAKIQSALEQVNTVVEERAAAAAPSAAPATTTATRAPATTTTTKTPTKAPKSANQDEYWKPWADIAATILTRAQAIETEYNKLVLEKAKLREQKRTMPKPVGLAEISSNGIDSQITAKENAQKALRADLEALKAEFDALNARFGGDVGNALPWSWSLFSTTAVTSRTYKRSYYDPIVTIFSAILEGTVAPEETAPSSGSISPMYEAVKNDSDVQFLMKQSAETQEARNICREKEKNYLDLVNKAAASPEKIEKAKRELDAARTDRDKKENDLTKLEGNVGQRFDQKTLEAIEAARIADAQAKIREDSAARMRKRLTGNEETAEKIALDAKKAAIRAQAEQDVQTEMAKRETDRQKAKEEGTGGWFSNLPDLGIQKKANELSDYLAANNIRLEAEKKIQSLEGKAGASSSSGWSEEEKQRDIQGGMNEAEAALRGLEAAEASGDSAAKQEAQERLDAAYEAVTSIQEAADAQ